jgi:sec-independent protein translocase protein TatA
VFDISPIQIVIVLAIALLIFGPKRLPEIGKSMGRGMREFKDSVTGKDEKEQKRAALTAATASEEQAPAARERDSVSG